MSDAYASLGYYDSSKLVPMSEYQYNYRTLDCWECFEAKGKMCHDKNYNSMISVTGSSNIAHGVCCKPDYEGEHCQTNDKQVCSQPVIDKSDKWASIVTADFVNNQLFAYCPGLS